MRAAPCILFLDFDGVTHPDPCEDDELFCRLPLLEEVLREHPSVEVVISSSWRLTHSLPQMRAFFAPDMRARVVGATPTRPRTASLPRELAGYERERECVAWMMNRQPKGFPWLALDDRSWSFRPDCEHLVLTRTRVGMTLETQGELREKLGHLTNARGVES